MAIGCPTEAWQSPTDISLEKSVKCLGAVSRIPSGSKRPDRCPQATEEQENREDLHRAGPSIDMPSLVVRRICPFAAPSFCGSSA
jgi:hypothetical protein